MAFAAAHALGLDLARSWVIGDSAADVGLARAVGSTPLLVGDEDPADESTLRFPDLAAAAQFVLGSPHDRSTGAAGTFPTHRYPDGGSYARDYASQLTAAMTSLDLGRVSAAADLLNAAYGRGATVFSCGNGGSASIANHMQCDHVKGVRNETGLLSRVISLSTNIEILSAIANDHGYDEIFEFQLQSMARAGDVLVAVSSSGRSPNIVRALTWAAEHGLQTVALTGFEGEPARSLADVSLHVECHNYGVVEDAHQACMHLLAQFVRQSRLPDHRIEQGTF
jgi:D-sedoheptulose 7-phosphate isomerase/D-glycero-D-manno-heptose 1,7-bisphosphate phosphatase